MAVNGLCNNNLLTCEKKNVPPYLEEIVHLILLDYIIDKKI